MSGDELTGRTVAQRAVGVNLVVMRQPGWKLAQHGLGVRNRGDANVVALQGAHERLSHAVRLWALERGRAGHQPDVPGEAAGLPGEVAAAVVVSHSISTGKRLTGPNLCSTAATMRSRTSSPVMPLVVATKLMASRSQIPASAPTIMMLMRAVTMVGKDLDDAAIFDLPAGALFDHSPHLGP